MVTILKFHTDCFSNLHCTGRGQKHGSRRRGSRDPVYVHLWMERKDVKTIKDFFSKKTLSNVLQKDLKIIHGASAVQSSDPEPSQPPFRSTAAELSCVFHFSFQRVVGRPPDGRLDRRRWASWCTQWPGPRGRSTTCCPSAKAGSDPQTLGPWKTVVILQIRIQSPKIVWVNGSCRAEMFLHKRGSWVGDFKIACFSAITMPLGSM